MEKGSEQPAKYENDREKARQALREAGLLTEIGPHLREIADPTVHLDEVNAAFERAGGRKLGEIILEQRGPKG